MSKRRRNRSTNQGFTLVELTLAMVVLVVGVLGGMTMVIIGMTRNNSNRVDTTATNVAQTVLEAVSAVPASTNTTITLTDCVQTDQTTSTLQVNTAVGGPLLAANGDIRWDVTAPAGYELTNYTVCGNNNLQTTYDVRWNVQAAGSGGFGKLVTVSARQPFSVGKSGVSWLPPVTLRTVVGL